VQGYQEHPLAEVVAIADTDPQKLQAVAETYAVPRQYPSAEQMLAEETLDVVSIATPNRFHKPQALAAFGAGCHVLVEKPMSISAAEGREMLAAANAAGKRLMINFSYRFYEQSRALKAQVDAGVLGEIYFGRSIWLRRTGWPGFGGWFGQKALSGGGPLIDLGVHRLDLALWLMGYPRPTWVIASTHNELAAPLAQKAGVLFDVEDFAAAFIRFETGASLEIEASWAAHIAQHEMMETRLLGTQGGLMQRNIGEGYEFEAEIYTEHSGTLFDMKMHNPNPWTPSLAVKGGMYHFIDSIAQDRPHIATGEEGLVVMQLLDAIYRSAETGEPVRVE
ncbi:MAG: Gfo/Idh/MocA family protein, partial [Planctomycetaceae bacterium]